MSEFIHHKAGSSEAQQKMGLAYHFRQDATGLATDGVLAGLGVSQQTTASKYVDVGLGSAVVQDSGSNGAAQLTSDAVKALDVLVTDVAEANPRNDLVVFDAATTSIRKIKGTANAVPTDPAVPATAVSLARVRVKSAATYAGNEVIATADIDDLRVYTALFGTPVDTGWTAVTLGTGWTAAAGYTPQVRKIGSVVHLRGALTKGAGATNTLVTVPAAFFPTNGQFLSAHTTSTGVTYHELHVNTSGVVAITYQDGGAATGTILPISGSWLVG